MNTETGQIYEPGEVERLRGEVRHWATEWGTAALDQMTPEQCEFAEADAAGRIVSVSPRVASLMKGAHRAERRKKRRAAKRARRKNR